MAPPSHPDVTLNEALVRELLAEQFPQLSAERIDFLGEEERRTYEVDGRFVFRFALDDADCAKLEREVALLPELGPKLPLAIPAPEFVGKASDAYPFTFVGYRTIDGLSGEVHRPTRGRWPAIAAQIGEFLSALHAFPLERARRYGVPAASSKDFGATYRTTNPLELLSRVQGFADVIQREVPDLIDGEIERYLSGRVALPQASQLAPVLCHADLKGEHIIVSKQADAVAGIIDWADCCVTDPLLDFTGLMIWLGEGFVRQVLDHYTCAVDEHFTERVCFYARCFTLDNLGAWLTTSWSAPIELLKTQARWAFAE